MSFTKRVPDEFGIIVPKDNGITWVKQGGGMSCIQRTLEGVYIPIGEMRYNFGHPEWTPSGPNFNRKLYKLDVQEELSESELEDIPAKVRRRGNFDGHKELFNWVEESEQYGWFSLYDELRRFTYGIFENLDTDPRERWGDVETLWETIRESFSFEYEIVDYEEYEELGLEDYPRPEAAIRPIRILGSKESDDGRVYSEWANDLEGEVVFLLCPNAD